MLYEDDAAELADKLSEVDAAEQLGDLVRSAVLQAQHQYAACLPMSVHLTELQTRLMQMLGRIAAENPPL